MVHNLLWPPHARRNAVMIRPHRQRASPRAARDTLHACLEADMDQRSCDALARDLTIDITTSGRRTGRPRRIEIWFHRVEGRYFITGTPGPRDWYANLLANPRFTVHLKESASADLPATAAPITDRCEKRHILLAATTVWSRPTERTVDRWVRSSPLVEILFDAP